MLQCHETGEGLVPGCLMVGCKKLGVYYGVNQGVVDQIPQEERHATPCESRDYGLNIHQAESNAPPGRDGAYSLANNTLCRGEFLFSVSNATAQKHLPKTKASIKAEQPKDK